MLPHLLRQQMLGIGPRLQTPPPQLGTGQLLTPQQKTRRKARVQHLLLQTESGASQHKTLVQTIR